MFLISKVYPPAKDGYFYKLLCKKSLTKYLIKIPVTKSKDFWVGNVKSSHREQVSTRKKAEMGV